MTKSESILGDEVSPKNYNLTIYQLEDVRSEERSSKGALHSTTKPQATNPTLYTSASFLGLSTTLNALSGF